VVGDALCGAEGTPVFDPKDPLDEGTAASSNPTFILPREPLLLILITVLAIIQLGDPTNRRKLAWHAGTSYWRGVCHQKSSLYCSKNR
jgi:hypothetical protein